MEHNTRRTLGIALAIVIVGGLVVAATAPAASAMVAPRLLKCAASATVESGPSGEGVGASAECDALYFD